MDLPFDKKFLPYLFIPIFLIALVTAGIKSELLDWRILPGAGTLAGESKARLLLEDRKVITTFDIASSDEENFKKFSQKLGTPEDISKGLNISIDEETTDILKKFLPLEVTLKITPQEVKFSSGGWQRLVRMPNEELIQSASFQGKLKVDDLGGGNFKIEIDNPAAVLSEATTSGNLRLSQKLAGRDFFQLAGKLAKIKIDIKNRFTEGVITLH